MEGLGCCLHGCGFIGGLGLIFCIRFLSPGLYRWLMAPWIALGDRLAGAGEPPGAQPSGGAGEKLEPASSGPVTGGEPVVPEPAAPEPVDPIVRALENGGRDLDERIGVLTERGDSAGLYELACDLEDAEGLGYEALRPLGRVLSSAEYSASVLAGPRATEDCLRFANLERQSSLEAHHIFHGRLKDRARFFASRLAVNQPVETVIGLLERHESRIDLEEVLFLLAHELVLVHDLTDDVEPVGRMGRRMRDRGHPLAWLPLHPADLESFHAEPFDPRVFTPRRGEGYAIQNSVYRSRIEHPWAPYPADRDQPFDAGLRRELWRAGRLPETTGDDDRRRIGTAVASWAEESNGHWEAKTFAAAPEIRAEPLDKYLLLSLDLDCVAGVREAAERDGTDRVRIFEIGPRQALAMLFRAAANGGDLGEGCFGAYGRLHAWQSFAGLCGAPGHTTIEGVIEVAQDTRWIFFSSPSDWFDDVINEFGLLAVRAGGGDLAVVAATDTD